MILKFLSKDSARRYVSPRHMKLFFNLFGMAAAGVLGYMAEPGLRFQLTGERPGTGLAPVTATDPLQPIAGNPPATVIPPVAPPVAVVPEPVMPASGEPEKPAAMPEPPASEPTPAPEPTPADEPTAAPEPAPTTAAGPTDADAVTAMQDSIKAAQIKEFTFDQVLEWKAEGDEIVDGETYQTGLASYKAETIFGVKTIQAKALIKGGKVQRWIWPKSGMEIK